MSAGQQFSVKNVGGVQVISFPMQCELDSSTMDLIQSSLYDVATGTSGSKIVLDFGNVTYAGSQALGCLVTLRMKSTRNGVTVVLANVPDTLAGIMRVTQIDKLFGIFPTRQAALEHLTVPASV